jgi:pantoate--beta-alanine ligase
LTTVIGSIAALRRALDPVRRSGESIGLVPTMGALHAGHRALIERAKAECDRVVVSLFVNALQFNQSSDFERYPRTLEGDLELCSQSGVDWLFAPTHQEMYPGEPLAFVQVERLTDGLCGERRPGHFRGVTTVCAKLFHIVGPERAYFGEKDYQQLQVIRRMVRDLNFPMQIVAAVTVRESDGLAMSSRNARLTPDQRRAAAVVWRCLEGARRLLAAGVAEAADLRAEVGRILASEPLVRVEYVEIVDPETLQAVERVEGEARLLVAVWIGEVRLIDNAPLTSG